MSKYNHNDIEDFLRGYMNETAESAFQKELTQDELLEEEFSFYKDVAEMVALKGLLEEVETDLTQKDFFDNSQTVEKGGMVMGTAPASNGKIISFQDRQRTRRRIMAFAAAITVLLIVGSFGVANMNYTNTALADLETERFVKLDDVRSGSEGANPINPFDEGLTALSDKDYAKAATFFEQASQSDNTSIKEEALLYKGFALYHQNEYEKAIAAITPVQNSSDIRFRQKAEWLKIQALLAKGQTDVEFFTLLNKVAQEERHIYGDQARDLQQKLNSFWRKIVF